MQSWLWRLLAIALVSTFLSSCGSKPNQPPIASVEIDHSSGNPPLEVNFDASKTTDPEMEAMTFAWEFGDGATGSGTNAAHTYTASGVYKVNLTVTDASGKAASIDRTITVNATPIASFTIDKTSGNYPLSVNVDASASNDPDEEPITFFWKVGDTMAGEEKAMTIELRNPGINVITLVVSDESGASSQVQQEVLVNYPPQARLKAKPGRGNAPLEVLFDASDSKDTDGEIIAYEWSINQEVVSKEINFTHIFEKSGVYTVALTVVDNRNTRVNATAKIMINGRPEVDLVATPITGTPPLEVSLDASGTRDPDGDSLTFTWDFGDGQNGEGPVQTHLYESSGKYQVSLEVTDKNGAMGSGERTIIVNRPPQPFILAGPQSGHVPVTVVFDASRSTDADGNELTFSWDFGDGTSAEGVRVEHTYEEQGNYTVSLTVNDGIESITNEETGIEALAPLPPVEKVYIKLYNLTGQIRLRVGDGILYEGGLTSLKRIDSSVLNPGMNEVIVERYQSAEEAGMRRKKDDYSHFFTILVDDDNRKTCVGKFGSDDPGEEWFAVQSIFINYEELTGKVTIYDSAPDGVN